VTISGVAGVEAHHWVGMVAALHLPVAAVNGPRVLHRLVGAEADLLSGEKDRPHEERIAAVSRRSVAEAVGMGVTVLAGAQITLLSALFPAPPQADVGTGAPSAVMALSATVSPVGLNPYEVM
jgi:hypothetical protein